MMSSNSDLPSSVITAAPSDVSQFQHTPFYWFFRVVHAPIFFRSFASDRRHMKDSVGNWTAEPPAYEAIVAEDGTVHNLNEYMEISTTNAVKDIGVEVVNAVYSQKLGVLVSENQLEEFFSLIS
ncbi:hypothetical protein Acr_12g0007590 [Actinidia rufa]|uniref:Protein N-terminal glutamine amidohydrolase n=1 Tax=Actinidia rufa TaxID=165716 RepID=A0A7J0FHP0_9ERIC|nr:hypothetical protein Acr_12g0007590 [Actinidia rufa]